MTHCSGCRADADKKARPGLMRQHSVGKADRSAGSSGKVFKRKGTGVRNSSHARQGKGIGQSKGKGRSRPQGQKGER
jgi:hypothetical protein